MYWQQVIGQLSMTSTQPARERLIYDVINHWVGSLLHSIPRLVNIHKGSLKKISSPEFPFDRELSVAVKSGTGLNFPFAPRRRRRSLEAVGGFASKARQDLNGIDAVLSGRIIGRSADRATLPE